MVYLYVDDLIYTKTSKDMVAKFKDAMMKEFKMSDLGLMRYFIGIQMKQSPGKNFISQEKYVANLFKKFDLSKCKLVTSAIQQMRSYNRMMMLLKRIQWFFWSLVGSLIYLTNSRPNILFPVSIISRFMEDPSRLHCAAAKESYDIFKEQRIMESCTRNKKITSWLVILTMTRPEAVMIGRVHLVMYFFLGTNIIS